MCREKWLELEEVWRTKLPLVDVVLWVVAVGRVESPALCLYIFTVSS